MLSLPLILHRKKNYTVYIHSKGARGLSVYLGVSRIFTANSISQSLCWRQWSSRYTIHAGRNLPDKEFRYLWTVRVTAAVYGGLKSEPKLIILTLPHRAGVSPYTSSFEFAETCVFIKQSLLPIMCQQILACAKLLLLLPKLQSQFAEFLQHIYLLRLSILYLFTSVGLQYGLIKNAIS